MREFRIRDRTIGDDYPPYVLADVTSVQVNRKLTLRERGDWNKDREKRWFGVSWEEKDRIARFVESLPLTTHTGNVLKRYGFGSAEELAETPDMYLLACRNLGRKGLAEIRAAIPYQGKQRYIRVRCPHCKGQGWIAEEQSQVEQH